MNATKNFFSDALSPKMCLLTLSFLVGSVLSVQAESQKQIQYRQPSAANPLPDHEIVEDTGGTRAELMFWEKHPERGNPDERKMLEKVAPVFGLDSKEAAESAPVRAAKDATAGAFIDQHGRVILLVTRTDMDKSTKDITIHFNGLAADGRYKAEDVFDPESQNEVTVSGGSGTITVPLERWQTRVFITDLSALKKQK